MSFIRRAPCADYPIISIEDPFEQDDWEHTKKLTDLKICQVRNISYFDLHVLHSENDYCLMSCCYVVNSRITLVTGNYLMWLSCVQVVGDDILVTNPKRVAKAIDENTCNALLLKVQDVLLLT